MGLGKEIRMRRMQTRGGSILMLPMDHGISMGPLEGLSPPGPTLEAVTGLATCVTMHRGLVRHALPSCDRLGVLMHLSASTDLAVDPDDKRIVACVEDAVRAGCDGVSIHINVGSRSEARQLEEAGAIAGACEAWGMPLVIMAYPRGPQIEASEPRLVAHAARIAAELGADAVKVPYTGQESFGRVVEGAGIPVIVAGGPSRPLEVLLADLEAAQGAGAAGVSIGRNVFASTHPAQAMQAIAKIFP